ncbi:pirin family protein [Thalassolituus sp. LLYu03]|uniref:pirin family protein n=1 Tax=Thalassolituus sp. LLYu03 TaxID=3421656 RepID=UPI003D2BE632
MVILRAANERGRANFGWLDSAHTFSFGNYYDPNFMGFSALRVINDDRVIAGAGFDTHGHRNMEIISLVLDGTIAHRDSEGNVAHLPAGEFQLMSAGRGIRHSEFNPSETGGLHFLQIWIQPDELNTPPGYQQKRFERTQPVQPVITPDGRDGTLSIRQDTVISHVRLEAERIGYGLSDARAYYLHVARGELVVRIDGQELTLRDGDGLAIAGESMIDLAAGAQAEALLFDLPAVDFHD